MFFLHFSASAVMSSILTVYQCYTMTSDNIVVIQADKLEPETKEKEEHERAVLLTLDEHCA